MIKQTMHDRLIAALRTLGAVSIPNKSRKYESFTLTNPSGKTTYLSVGKMGALRVGWPLSNTFGATDAYKQHLLDHAAALRLVKE